MIKKFRQWLAGKILGTKITSYEVAKHEWMKEQLEKGNTVTLEYTVTPVEQITTH